MPPLVSGSFSNSSPTCLATQGMTSGQWLAAFPDGDALRREVDLPAPAWPVGEVEASKPDTNDNPFNRGFRFDMLLRRAPGGPFFTDYTVSLENNQQEVSLRDGLGHLQKTDSS